MTFFRPLATFVMASAFGFFGVAKIVQLSIVTGGAAWPRLHEMFWASIGLLEISAAISLVAALHPRFRRLGLAAATGLAALTLCAVIFHLTNGDSVGDWAPAVIQGCLASAYVATGVRDVERPTVRTNLAT